MVCTKMHKKYHSITVTCSHNLSFSVWHSSLFFWVVSRLGTIGAQTQIWFVNFRPGVHYLIVASRGCCYTDVSWVRWWLTNSGSKLFDNHRLWNFCIVWTKHIRFHSFLAWGVWSFLYHVCIGLIANCFSPFLQLFPVFICMQGRPYGWL